MDTAEVAQALSTTPTILRRFLRSPVSQLCSVGSGARYELESADMPDLVERFKAWQSNKATTRPRKRVTPRVPLRATMPQVERDEVVWAEDEAERGPIVLEDIRDPAVRARVRQVAAAQEARLNALLIARGMHVSQMSRAA